MSASIPSPLAREARSPVWRDALLALLVAVGGYALSCAIAAPGNEAKGFGIQWQLMSADPLALPGQFPHRILAPLLGWSLGLGGASFLWFVRGLSVFLLGTVFFFARRRGAAPVDAGLVTLAIALTAAVQLYKDHWVGYPDALGYALFFWTLLAAERPALFWALFFANLLNHELAAFLLPWLWFVRRQVHGSWRVDVLGAGAALAAYAAFYLWVKAQAPAQVFHANYFAEHPLFPGGTVVVWFLALTHLAVAFGPVLAVLAWHQHRPEHGRERWHLWLVAGGVVVIFCIAFDWARHSNLVVIPLVLASLRFLAAGHRRAYALLVGLGAALMLWIPPWSPTAWPTDAMANLPFLMQHGVVVVENGDYFTGTLAASLTRWLPAVAPILGPVLGVLAAIWLTGFLLARRRIADEAPPGRAG